MQQKVTELLKQANDEEKMILTAFANARRNTLIAYNEDNSAARKKDYDAADTGLTELVEKLEQKYAPEPTATTAQYDPAGVLYKNSTEMYQQLKEKGWGISSRQTLTNHAKRGYLQLAPDRSITVAAFELWKNHPSGGQKYYEAYVKHRRDSYGSIDDNALRQSVAETKLKEAKARVAERDEQQALGAIISRIDADIEICAWAALTRDALIHRITQIIPAIIQATGGQLAALPDAQMLLDQAIDTACNDIAGSSNVDVEIENEEEDQ